MRVKVRKITAGRWVYYRTLVHGARDPVCNSTQCTMQRQQRDAAVLQVVGPNVIIRGSSKDT